MIRPVAIVVEMTLEEPLRAGAWSDRAGDRYVGAPRGK